MKKALVLNKFRSNDTVLNQILNLNYELNELNKHLPPFLPPPTFPLIERKSIYFYKLVELEVYVNLTDIEFFLKNKNRRDCLISLIKNKNEIKFIMTRETNRLYNLLFVYYVFYFNFEQIVLPMLNNKLDYLQSEVLTHK